jgi:PIN domain nuclease of toxin-antitoxin system
MNYLLDTHVMLWFLEDSAQLSPKARKIIENGENLIYWSAASFWEITVKVSLGKIQLQDNWIEALELEKKVNRIIDLPMKEAHCIPHLKLPWIHKDPFDRILICQALAEKLIILTKDAHIQRYKVKTIW